MVDTLWADVSQFQVNVNDSYPYHFLSFRSNDGTYRDTHFQANLTWAKKQADNGGLAGFIVYLVYEPDWRATFETFKAAVGVPHPKMAVMIDAETWSGRMSGDHSPRLNALREAIIKWLGSHMPSWARLKKLHRKRVIGYGNAYDLLTMWARRGDIKVVLANYSSNPNFPNKLAHQWSDRYVIPPFGPCDVNSADGLSPKALAAALGLGPYKAIKPVVTPLPVPVPPTPVPPRPSPAPKPMATEEMRTYLDAQFAAVRDRILANYNPKNG